MRKYYGIIVLLFCVKIGTAQTENSTYKNDSTILKKIADDVMTNGTAYENLRYLCKKIGPRLSGSTGAEKAVLATKKMLQDAGADTVYLQPCMVTHWVRGAKEVGYAVVDNKKIALQITSLGNSEGSGGKLIGADIVEVKTMEELHKLGTAVKGKMVFFNIAMNPTLIQTFSAYGASGVGRRSGPSEAARYGAIACLVRSLASNVDDHPHTGATRYNDSLAKIPAVAISTSNAELLSANIKAKKKVQVFFKNNCTMLPDVLSYNVIGEIRGTTYPEEILTVGGHLDSWDLAEGAHDDGAGIVQSIEVIRAIKAAGIKPKRTIRSVMFMNEENGGGGGNAYAAFAKEKKEQHIFALESDAGGFTPRGFTFGMSKEKIAAIQQWEKLFYPYGVYELRAGGGGSDIQPLADMGVPVSGLRVDSQRYFDVHHAETDIFEAVNKRELHLGALNMTALIWLVSEYGL
jgi:carboxypeptidase Q